MKELGDCGYAHYEHLLKQVVRVLLKNCESEKEAKEALGDNYDEWDEDRKKFRLQRRFGQR
jgi:hypothetical protein